MWCIYALIVGLDVAQKESRQLRLVLNGCTTTQERSKKQYG